MARRPVAIDRAKLRAVVRRLSHEEVFLMLDDAIEVLPPAKLLAIAGKYVDLALVRPGADTTARPGLLAAVRHFRRGPAWRGSTTSPLPSTRRATPAVLRHDSVDRRVPAASRPVRHRGAARRSSRGSPGLRHRLRSLGPHRRVPRRRRLLRRRGWIVAGRRRLAQGPSSLVRGPLGHSRPGGVRRADHFHAGAPLQLRPRRHAGCRPPDRDARTARCPGRCGRSSGEPTSARTKP